MLEWFAKKIISLETFSFHFVNCYLTLTSYKLQITPVYVFDVSPSCDHEAFYFCLTC